MLNVNPDVLLQNHIIKLGIYIKLHVNLKYKLLSVSQCKRTESALSKHFIISQTKETIKNKHLTAALVQRFCPPAPFFLILPL